QVSEANAQNGRPNLVRNGTPRGKDHWLELNRVETRSNRDGCGARIVAAIKGARLLREVLCGSEGLSGGSDKVVHFGLGRSRLVRTLTVTWPSGLRQVLRNLKADP